MSLFDIIRSAIPPTTGSNGIGGTARTIWFCAEFDDEVHELSVSDFSSIRFDSSPDGNPNGIGGDDNTIWLVDGIADKVYELSTVDLSLIRQAASPGGGGSAIGGDVDNIWHGDSVLRDIFELSTVDFSVVQQEDEPNLYNPYGMGGNGVDVWLSSQQPGETTNGYWYKIDPTDLTSITSRAHGGGVDYTGIGGDSDSMWGASSTWVDPVEFVYVYEYFIRDKTNAILFGMNF